MTEAERVAGRLAFQYDREGDILHIRSRLSERASSTRAGSPMVA
jgi:hypothetical protein